LFSKVKTILKQLTMTEAHKDTV